MLFLIANHEHAMLQEERMLSDSPDAAQGVLSYDDFRRAVRRANVKTNVISDKDLQDIATIVDADGR